MSAIEDFKELSFTLKDRHGEEVDYMVSPHIGTDGLKVVDAMLGIGLGPMAEAAFAAARAAAKDKAEGDGELSSNTIERILEQINLDHVVTSAQAGIKSMGGMAVLAPLVMQHTTRKGVRLVTARGDRSGFDLAYTRNWREFRDAFARVMEINGFFELLAGLFDETD